MTKRNRKCKVRPYEVPAKSDDNDKLKSDGKMANVRKSSAFLKELDRTHPTERNGEDNNSKHGAQAVVIEMEAPLEEKVDSAKARKRVNPPRRYSTGSASDVNTANLRASIRRLQQRRFRAKKSCTVKYLEFFLSFLYYIGMSPLKPASARQLPKWCLRIQLAIYWILALLSVLEATALAKTGWIEFRVEENMLKFISLGYFVANFLTRIYYIKAFATSSEATSILLEKIHNANSEPNVQHDNWAYWTVAMIGILSLSLALVNAVMGEEELNDWSLKDALLLRSTEFRMSFVIWSSNNWENTTTYFLNEYEKGLTGINQLLAVLGNALNLCGTLHACVLLDIWVVVTIQIYTLQSEFSKTVKGTSIGKDWERCPLNVHWEYYLRLRDVCDQCDEVFGKLLKLIHMQNMLLFGYFLLEILKKKPLSAPLLINMVTVMKVLITYYLAQRTAAKNGQYETCVISCSKEKPTIEMNGSKISLLMLLKNMKKHPIGVGRGEFFIDEGFLLKFAGAVGSIFVLLSGETEKTCIVEKSK